MITGRINQGAAPPSEGFQSSERQRPRPRVEGADDAALRITRGVTRASHAHHAYPLVCLFERRKSRGAGGARPSDTIDRSIIPIRKTCTPKAHAFGEATVRRGILYNIIPPPLLLKILLARNSRVKTLARTPRRSGRRVVSRK